MKDKLLTTLKELLHDVLEARYEGVAYTRLARAHGYADGYMRALLDAELMSRDELLDLVGEQRRSFLDEEPKSSALSADEGMHANVA